MKWFAWLLSFYILLLSGIPCSAQDNCCIEEIKTTTDAHQCPEEADHNPTCPCSPFFACGANHGAIVPVLYPNLLEVLPEVRKEYPFFNEETLVRFSAIVRQPPKTAGLFTC